MDHCYKEGCVLEGHEDMGTEYKSLLNCQRDELPWKIMEKAKKFICACLNAAITGIIYFGILDCKEQNSKYKHGQIRGLDVEDIKDEIIQAFETVLNNHIFYVCDNGTLQKGVNQNCVDIFFVPVKTSQQSHDLYVIEIEVARDWDLCKDDVYYSRQWKESEKQGRRDGTGLKKLETFFKVKEDQMEDVAFRRNGASCGIKPWFVQKEVKYPLRVKYKQWKRNRKQG